MLRQRHRLRNSDPDDFYVRDMTELTKTMASTSELMTKLLLCVAMISLVVGGIGIMNIMLVSVTERTREIGLRMAVGAEPNDILRQFLAEAVASVPAWRDDRHPFGARQFLRHIFGVALADGNFH